MLWPTSAFTAALLEATSLTRGEVSSEAGSPPASTWGGWGRSRAHLLPEGEQEGQQPPRVGHHLGLGELGHPGVGHPSTTTLTLERSNLEKLSMDTRVCSDPSSQSAHRPHLVLLRSSLFARIVSKLN